MTEVLDSPQIRQAGRDALSLALIDARNHLLWLLDMVAGALGDPEMRVAPSTESEPPLWLAGHAAWFAEFWISRNPQRALGPRCPSQPTRLASLWPTADALWNPALASREARWQSDHLDALGAAPMEAAKAYMLETLEVSLDLLAKAPESDEALYFYRLALCHEDMLCERLLVLAQSQGLAINAKLPLLAPGVRANQARNALLFPASQWMLGTGAGAGGFAFDIEMGEHRVAVPEFEIDAQPVCWAQFVEFVDDNGYDREDLWSAHGWAWLQNMVAHDGRRAPRYVEQIGVASGAVMQTRFGRATRMSGAHPAMHVSWWEGQAWANWAGRRLATEVEWEIAATSARQRGFSWGDVHEWTAGSLQPWPGFSASPVGQSAPWFGIAKVVRGGSFATRLRMKHPRNRGYALPERDDAFVGFRTCAV